MGPNDPYTTPSARPRSTDTLPPDGSPEKRRGRGDFGLLIGLGLGLLFGVLVLLESFGAALLVVFCGAVGSVIGYLIHGFALDRFDFGAAWRALRRGP